MTIFQQPQMRKALGRAGLALAAIATAVVFFLLGVVFRVLMGPVSLGPLNEELRTALKRQLPGLQLKFDEAALEWSPEEGRMNLVIFGTRVFDRNDRIIAQAPEAELGLAAGPFLAGDIIIRRITLVGVQLTLVHTAAGALRFGIERDSTQSDILKEIKDAIARNSSGAASALKSFAIHRARLAFYDEGTGLFVVAPEAELQITDGAIGRSSIKATVDAQLELSGRPSHLLATLAIPRDGNTLSGDFSLAKLQLDALASNSATFAFLKPFALTTDVSGSFTLLHGTYLETADVGIGASGFVEGFGKPLHVKSLRLVGRYDGRTGRLLIDDADVQGEQLRAHVTGRSDLTFKTNGALASAAYSISVDRLGANMPGVFPQSVSFAQAQLSGAYDPATLRVALDQATVLAGPLSASFAGKMDLSDGKSPAISLDGKVNAIGVRDMLRFWPLNVGSGARSWVDRNISVGRIGPVVVHTNIAAGALDKPVLPENALSVAFPISAATVTYIHGLTPLSGVTGTAELSGDTFKADLASASIGPLALTQGKVAIPNLHMHGMVGDVRAHVEGSLPNALALVDMKPLQYPTRFHINPATTQGDAAVDIDIHVPMVREIGVDRIGISVKANVSRLAVALGQHTKVSNGSMVFDVDNSRLHAAGQIALGTTPLSVDWLEAFRSSPFTTHLTVRGTLDDNARAAFNLHTDQILSGPVGIVAQLDGYRGSLERAQIDADLTPADLSVDLVNMKKPAGTPAAAVVSARLDAGGNLRTADLSISGNPLSAKGSAAFGAGGDLQRLDLSSVRDGGLNDFALSMSETPSAGLNLVVSGHSADGTALGRKSTRSGGTGKVAAASSEPFHVSAKLDRLVLRDGVSMSPMALDVSGLGQRPRTLALSAMLSKSAQVTASIASSDAERKVAIASNDAGLLLKGLFGFTSVKGGQLSLNATMPPLGAAPKKEGVDYSGQAVIRDCTVVNQAFLTRLFSSGSLEGFVDLMRGQGITIETLDVPFRVSGDVVEIHDARAAGPSIGITTDGYIDRANDQLALEGAIAPLYGLNGVLGAIPVLGNVFVSKKGEGIFGVTYHASGNADEPRVTVNPLAMLAPGILRRLFEGNGPSLQSPQANTAPKKAQ